MIVIVIGAGTIGGSLAEVLLQAGYDVIVIDIEKHPLDRLENFLDVQTIQGHGCDPAILEMAKVSEAEFGAQHDQRRRTQPAGHDGGQTAGRQASRGPGTFGPLPQRWTSLISARRWAST